MTKPFSEPKKRKKFARVPVESPHLVDEGYDTRQQSGFGDAHSPLSLPPSGELECYRSRNNQGEVRDISTRQCWLYANLKDEKFWSPERLHEKVLLLYACSFQDIPRFTMLNELSLKECYRLLQTYRPYNTLRERFMTNSDYDMLNNQDTVDLLNVFAAFITLRCTGHIFCSLQQFTEWINCGNVVKVSVK